MNTPGVREQIKFGRIYGSGRRDYIYLKEEDTYYDMLVWENQGAGGTKLKGLKCSPFVMSGLSNNPGSLF